MCASIKSAAVFVTVQSAYDFLHYAFRATSDKSRKLAKLQLAFYHERNRKELKLCELRYYSTQG